MTAREKIVVIFFHLWKDNELELTYVHLMLWRLPINIRNLQSVFLSFMRKRRVRNMYFMS